MMHFMHGGARYHGFEQTRDSRERASSLRSGRGAPQQRFRSFSVDSTSSDASVGSPISRNTAPSDGSVVALDCTKDAAAKSWSSSKIRYSWALIVDGKQHVVVFTNSRSSGKKRVFVDGNLVTEQKTFRANQFQYRWHIGRHLCTICPDSDGFFGQVDCAFELRIDGRPFDQYKQRGGRPQPFRPQQQQQQQQQQQFRPPPNVAHPPAQQQRRQDDFDDEELKRALAMSAAEERDRQAKLRGTGGTANATQATKRSVELAREAQRAAARTQAATTSAARQPPQSASAARDMDEDLLEQMEQAAILASLEESGRISQSNGRSQTTPVREDAFQQSTTPSSKSVWGADVPSPRQKKKKSKEVVDPWSTAAPFAATYSAPADFASTSAFGSVSGFADDSKSSTSAWPVSNETSGWPPPPPSRTCSVRSSFDSADGSFKAEDSFLSQSSNGRSPAATMDSGFGSWEALDQQKDDAPNPWGGCDSPMSRLSVQSAPVFSQSVLAPVVEPLNPWADIASQTTPKSPPTQSQAIDSDPWGIHLSAQPEAKPSGGENSQADPWPSSSSTQGADPWPPSSSAQGVQLSAHFTPVDPPVDPWSGAAEESPAPSPAVATSPTAQESVASPWPPLQPVSASPTPWPPPQSSESITTPWPTPAVAEAWPPVAAASSPAVVQTSHAPWPNVKDHALDAPANPFSNSEWPPKAAASTPTPWP